MGFNPRTRVGCDLIRFMRRMGFIVFQSTHPRGVRPLLQASPDLRASVSIHAPAWGATQDLEEPLPLSLVSIHAPAWGATCVCAGLLSGIIRFQSTHPRGVRLGQIMSIRRSLPSFNPRTRVGCDDSTYAPTPAYRQFQSTHPRGVRPFVSVRCRVCYEVSIHAPAWGATSSQFAMPADAPVSIHAPAWGATSLHIERTRHAISFNPRTRVGCDHPSLGRSFTASRFNPRTRVGCDGSPQDVVSSYKGFNPRTRVGCDGVFSLLCRKVEVSIHAPAWGATLKRLRYYLGKRSFNPRTRVGCDPGPQACPACRCRFQSTHPRGVRQELQLRLRLTKGRFNPRTRVGCDGKRAMFVVVS